MPECDIRENLDTNEYWIIKYIRIKKLQKQISKYICTIFFDTNECPNKYLSWKLYKYSNIFKYSSSFNTHEWMSEYIRTNKFDTNKYIRKKLICTNVCIYCDPYIWIFEYSNIFVTLWYFVLCTPTLYRRQNKFVHIY